MGNMRPSVLGIALIGLALARSAAAEPCVPSPLEPNCPTPYNPVPTRTRGIEVGNFDLGGGGRESSAGTTNWLLQAQVTLARYDVPGSTIALAKLGYWLAGAGGIDRSLLRFHLLDGTIFFGSKANGFCTFPIVCDNDGGRIGVRLSVVDYQHDFVTDRYAARWIDGRLATSLIGPAFHEAYAHGQRFVLSLGASVDHVGHVNVGDGVWVGRMVAGADYAARFAGERLQLDANVAFRPSLIDVGFEAALGVSWLGVATPVFDSWMVTLRGVYSYWSNPGLAMGELAAFDASHTFSMVLSFQPTIRKVP